MRCDGSGGAPCLMQLLPFMTVWFDGSPQERIPARPRRPSTAFRHLLALIGFAPPALLAFSSVWAQTVANGHPAQPCRVQWISAYYAGWMQRKSHLLPHEIDFAAVTHILHFALCPTATGGFKPDCNGLTADGARDIVETAHAAGRKVLISVGGQNSAARFREATSPAHFDTFVDNLMSFVSAHGYDGIDIDWEPLAGDDHRQFAALVRALRTRLDTHGCCRLLTAAADRGREIFAALHGQLDQINLMTYNMAGPWPGWVSWHNSAVFSGPYAMPLTLEPLPAIDAWVERWTAAGIPREKLGIGVDFYAREWRGGNGTESGGVTKQGQGWRSAPEVVEVPYFEVMNRYGAHAQAWDDSAKAAFISIDAPSDADDRFISLDNERSIAAKADYVRERGLGGVMLWELGGGYRPGLPAEARAPLLSAVAQAFGCAAQDGHRR